FGHDGCAVLLGGIEAWGGLLAAADEAIEPLEFMPRERSDDTVQADELVRRLADPRLVLVDARPAPRWRGGPTPTDDRPARTPGARNAPGAEPQPEAFPEGELVAYCGSGVTACVVLHHASLRRREGRLYPGSWSEWSKRGLPIERG